jgi:RHS repeat-associated protein
VATFNVPPPTVTQFYHLDVLGSVRAVTGTDGAVLRRHDYAAFGEELHTEEAEPGLPYVAKQQRFTGKERDGESGLDYFAARYHSSGWGRFTSVDPVLPVAKALTRPQEWNRYAYVTNNPLRFLDPDGRQTVCGACQGIAERSAVIRDRVARWFGANDPSQSAIMEVAQAAVDAALAMIAPQTADEMNANMIGGPLGILENAAAGRAAEVASGIVKNVSRIDSLTGTAKYRVPDILDRAARIIGDVKVNSTTLRLTSQLQDFIAFAMEMNFKLILKVSDPNKVHPALRREVERIGGVIEGMD